MHYKRIYRYNWHYILRQVQRRIWFNRRLERHAQFIAAIFFIGVFLIICVGNYTLIKWMTISRIWIAISMVIIFLPKQFFPVVYLLHKELKLLLALFGIGPFLTGLFLLLNFLIVVESKNEVFPVTKSVYIYSDQLMEVSFMIGDMEPHRESRRIETKSVYQKPVSVAYQINTGIFKIKTLRDGELIYSGDPSFP
jgi:hypothetical protein